MEIDAPPAPPAPVEDISSSSSTSSSSDTETENPPEPKQKKKKKRHRKASSVFRQCFRPDPKFKHQFLCLVSPEKSDIRGKTHRADTISSRRGSSNLIQHLRIW